MGRNAMTSERDTDETARTENHSSVNRRSFVKALGGAGGVAALGTAGTTGAFAKSTRPKGDVESQDVSEAEESELIAEALDDPKTNRIEQKFTELNWTLQRNQANVVQVRNEEIKSEYYVAILPFDTTGDGQSYILWSDSSRITITGFHTEQTGTSLTESYEVTNYTVSDGQLQTDTRTISPEEVREFKQKIGEQGSGGLTTQGFPNCNINFQCVSTAAAKAGILAGACGTCTPATLLGCAACAGAGIQFVNTDCSLCK